MLLYLQIVGYGLRLVSLSHANGITTNSVTYNSVSMTQVDQQQNTSISQRLSMWFLDDNASGSNTLQINFSANLWTPLSLAVYSFTNCGGRGSNGLNFAYSSSEPTITLNCSEDSLIMGRAQAFQGMGSPGITIDGTVYNAFNADFQHNTNSQAWGKLGANTVSSGNRVIAFKATSGFCVAMAIEIKGVTATASRRIFLVT
jgi:hypothetical protein